MTSGASSARDSEFITYLLPNICSIWSKNLHSCFSPLKKQHMIRSKTSCSNNNFTNMSGGPLLLSSLQEMFEVGPQPLYPGLALLRRAQVALAAHRLRDLFVDVFVLGTALHVLLDLLAPPDVQQGLGLSVPPSQFGVVTHPLVT